jgi:hypothetical protein
LQYFRYGLSGPAINSYDRNYLTNKDFNAYESFQRACSDLDQKLAEQEREATITITKGMISLIPSIWSDLLSGSRRERPQSAPYHLQPCRLPEISLIQDILMSILKSLQGINIPISMLFRALCRELSLAFWKLFLRSGITRFYADRDIPEGSFKLSELGFPPAFKEWLNRMLSRMLMFFVKRACSDGTHHRDTECVHRYGERLDFNAVVKNEVVLRRRGEVV